MIVGAGAAVVCSTLGGVLPFLAVTFPQEVSRKARDLHFRSLVIDTHTDTTQLLLGGDFDLATEHPDGSVDIPRLRAGGIGAIFFAVWIPGTVTGPEAVRRAMEQIDAVRRHVERHPRDLTLARTSRDIRAARASGRIAVVLALEGGHMLNRDLAVLRQYAALGVRYVTLTHMKNTDVADASTDEPLHNGLSDFGKQAIREMNRLGVAVDVSHVSDKTIRDVLEISEAPVFASHSSCKVLCDSPRNLTDDLMRELAARRGLIQINFHAGFISQKFRDVEKVHPNLYEEVEAEAEKRCGENDPRRMIVEDKIIREYVAAGKLPRVDWREIIDHIDHAVKVVGADHVGLGSDFDGADMPYGMEDASRFPQFTEALLEKGYSEADIQKILGGNALRFLEEVEAAAKHLEGTKS